MHLKLGGVKRTWLHNMAFSGKKHLLQKAGAGCTCFHSHDSSCDEPRIILWKLHIIQKWNWFCHKCHQISHSSKLQVIFHLCNRFLLISQKLLYWTIIQVGKSTISSNSKNPMWLWHLVDIPQEKMLTITWIRKETVAGQSTFYEARGSPSLSSFSLMLISIITFWPPPTLPDIIIIFIIIFQLA